MSDLEAEIAALETRLAEERAASLRAFEAYKTQVREEITSFTGLGVLVAVGFIVGSLFRRRRPSSPESGSSAMGMIAALASLAAALARARSEHHRLTALERHFSRPESPDSATPPDEFLAVEEGRGGPS